MNLTAGRIRGRRGCAGIALACLTMITNARGAELPDRAELAAILEHQWSSLVDLEFESDISSYDGWGKLLSVEHFRFGYGAGGRWFVRSSMVKDGELVGEHEVREDGKLHYQPRYFGLQREAMESLTITRTRSTPREYRGSMSPALWTFLPGGRPPADWLADPATRLIPVTLESGKEGLELTADHRGRALEIQLDPEQGFLSCRVKLEGSFTIRVTRFETDNGREFPIEGEMKSERADGPARRSFLVTTL